MALKSHWVPCSRTPFRSRASSLSSQLPFLINGAHEYTQRFLQSLLLRPSMRAATSIQFTGSFSAQFVSVSQSAISVALNSFPLPYWDTAASSISVSVLVHGLELLILPMSL
jgi:hypothetical protein